MIDGSWTLNFDLVSLFRHSRYFSEVTAIAEPGQA